MLMNVDLIAASVSGLPPTSKGSQRSIVVIDSQGPDGRRLGTGFSVRRGWVATSAHVVEGGDIYVGILRGNRYVAVRPTKTIKVDGVDLAFLKIDQKVPPIRFSTAQAAVGQRVWTLGFPLGPDSRGVFSCSLSKGFINGFRYDEMFSRGDSLIQADVAIAAGSSGSPIMDGHSRLIGMVEAKAGTGDETANSMSFALGLPAKVIKSAMSRHHI